jgi:hypothetical protein
MTRIVTTTYRYRRPPGHKKPEALAVQPVAKAANPAKARKRAAAAAIVTIGKPGHRNISVQDLTPAEHRRRTDAADALFHDIVGRVARQRS